MVQTLSSDQVPPALSRRSASVTAIMVGAVVGSW